MENSAVTHCSDSSFGNLQLIDKWHSKRFTPYVNLHGIKIYCAYHFVILNGFEWGRLSYNPLLDGSIQPGRPIGVKGPHAGRGNSINGTPTIGICLIGESGIFTPKQLAALLDLLIWLQPKGIFRHSDFDQKRRAFCPGLSEAVYKSFISFYDVRKKKEEERRLPRNQSN